MQKRRDVRRIHEELEELFADLWQVPGFAGLRQGFRPQVDCYRTDEPPAVTLVVDLAGIDPDEVSIEVTERTIVISGVRRRPKLDCRVSYRQMESSTARSSVGSPSPRTSTRRAARRATSAACSRWCSARAEAARRQRHIVLDRRKAT